VLNVDADGACVDEIVVSLEDDGQLWLKQREEEGCVGVGVMFGITATHRCYICLPSHRARLSPHCTTQPCVIPQGALAHHIAVTSAKERHIMTKYEQSGRDNIGPFRP
jgi:hypothetical protein